MKKPEITTAIPFSLKISSASEVLSKVVLKTPLQYNKKLSEKYEAEVYLKREDLQVVRSYKIRGAYNLMHSLDSEQRRKGIACASAGNHAQGVAFSCHLLDIHGIIFMPAKTPPQKINQVKMFGGDKVEIILVGDTFDECQEIALKHAEAEDKAYVPPFDHLKIIEGQGTVGKEILDEMPGIDFLFVPVGGGGLCAGIGSYFNTYSPDTKIIGAEPFGAPSMKEALKAGEPVTLESIEQFVDGASVKRVGNLTLKICKDVLDEMLLVPEGNVSSAILRLYNEDGIVVEPAGALSIAALDHVADDIRGKKVVCIVSGGNNDINRIQEIRDRSLLYEGLRQYFIIRFAQKPGALKDFVNTVLGPNDDVVRFEYIQKHNKETGPALIGINVKGKNDLSSLLKRMDNYGLNYTVINQDENLFEYLV